MKSRVLLTVLASIIYLASPCFCSSALAQTTMFADSFKSKVDTTNHPKLPTGWTTGGGSKKWVFTKDNADPSSTPPVLFAFCADANPTHGVIYGVSLDTASTLTSPDLFAGITTTGYKTISVSWVEMFSPKFAASNDSANSVAFSIDGTTWDTLAHSRNFVNNTYGKTNGGKAIALPAKAVGAAHLYLKWTFYPKQPKGNYAMTDVVVTGATGSSGIDQIIYATDKIKAYYSNGNLNVHFMNSDNGLAQMALYSIDGKQVSSSVLNTSGDKTINLSNIPAGVYIAKFTMNGQVYNTKFVK